jgi:peptidoglycan L-alanyl-D-glutamate endopeptidase CwlK
MDQISLIRIKTAHPEYRDELGALYNKANNVLGKNVRLRLAYVYRTPEEQHRLFLQRPKVTKADRWQSIHNYGLAFDIVLLIDKDDNGTFETATWDTIKDFDGDKIADWMEVVKVFKAAGWEWGGDWKKFPDAPHFQKTNGFDWKVLKQRIDKGITIIDNGITYPKI